MGGPVLGLVGRGSGGRRGPALSSPPGRSGSECRPVKWPCASLSLHRHSFFPSPRLWQGSGAFVLCPFVHVLTACACGPNPSSQNSLAVVLGAACTCERGAPGWPGRWPERASQREQSAWVPVDGTAPHGGPEALGVQSGSAEPRRACTCGTWGSAGW